MKKLARVQITKPCHNYKEGDEVIVKYPSVKVYLEHYKSFVVYGESTGIRDDYCKVLEVFEEVSS